MAISDKDIFDYFASPDKKSDEQIARDMDTYRVTPEDVARVTGADLGNVQSRYQAASAPANPAGLASLPGANITANNTTSGLGSLAATKGTDLITDSATDLNSNITKVVTNPYDSITSALNKGAYDTVGGLLNSTGLNESQFKSYYNFDDNLADFVFGRGSYAPKVIDTVVGAAGNDTLVGAKGNDTVVGTKGIDTLVGAVGNDTLVGAAGNDTVVGATGSNNLNNVFTQISNAWVNGDYEETAKLLKANNITPKQLQDHYQLGDSTLDFVLQQGVYGPKVSTFVSPVVSVSPKTIDSLFVTGSDGKLLDVPGYGEVNASTLNTWEPWRLEILGITKNADGTFGYTGGPAWTTATGTNKSLFDQINNISNLEGMNSLFTGGALGKDKGGLGSKEAVLWDFANKLAAEDITSLADIGKRTVTKTRETESGTEEYQEEEIYNKKTGKAFNIQGTTLGNNETNYGFTFTNTGLAIPTTTEVKNGWADFKENTLPVVLTAVSLAYPPAAPYIQAYNAAKAAQNGQWASAAFSALTSASGFAADVTSEINALIKAGDLAGAEQLYNNSWLAQNVGNIKTKMRHQ